ncbi:MAG: TonB-dependent receptor [Desulfobacter sp.]
MKAFLEVKQQEVYQSLLIILCIICFLAPARAADTTTTGGASGAEETARQELAEKTAEKPARTEVETIKVTARKKEEDVQKVPMSLSVFSNQVIEEAGVSNTSELLRYSPNVYVRDAGNNHQTIIRGVTGFETALHSSTGYYIDDVNIPLIYMQNPELLDIERVEVLKGPQGTLYGRNSESGVVNLVTRQPDNEKRGKVFAEYNFYDSEHGNKPGYNVGASLSTPVVKDKFYIALNGKYEKSDGYIENVYDNDDEADDKRKTNGRVNLRWTPSDAWDNALIIDMMDSEDGYTNGRLKEFDDRHTVNWDAPHSREVNANTQALRLKYHGSDLDLLSVTGRSYFDDEALADFDMSSQPNFPSTQKEEDTLYSQEFRISSSADTDSPFSWLTGTYFFQEDLDTFYAIDGVFTALNSSRSTDIDIKGAAIFGQATYSVMERLHFTAGLRYDYQDMEGTQTLTQSSGTTTFSAEDSTGELLPKASIAYDLTEDAMAYATVAKGYMSGGFTYAMATDSETLMYGPEYTWNYEVGFKSSWLDNRLVANLAAFYIDMEDKQVSEVNSTTLTSKVVNAAEARSYGFELELQARPTRGWSIYGGVGITDTEIEEWNESTGAVETDYEGHELPNAPSLTYNIGTQYMHDTGIYGRAELLGTGDFYHDSQNTLKESAYEIVNLRIGYMMEKFEIAFWCNNIFDTDYKRVQFNWAGMTGVFDGIPRQVGTTVTYRF